jgi:chromosome segregation ATPase
MNFFLTKQIVKLLELLDVNIMSAEKIKKKTPTTKIIDDVYEEYQEQKENILNANALVKDSNFTNKLAKIEEQLSAIVDKQQNGVSAEFNALMDGYVNKANESQEFKVKANHLESLYEELKIEAKTFKEENKRLKADLEATKEALRMSESDIKRLKNESEHSKVSFQEQINTLNDEKANLKNKLKEVQTQNDKNIQNYNNIKSELLEQKYRVKQFEQEKQVEEETIKRTNRETTKLIDELKEKLELRTREVEYKDALLNQLIKQVSVEDNVGARLNSMMPANTDKFSSETKIDSKPKPFFEEEQDEIREAAKNENHQSLKQSIKSRFSRKNDGGGTSWGPFRKR